MITSYLCSHASATREVIFKMTHPRGELTRVVSALPIRARWQVVSCKHSHGLYIIYGISPLMRFRWWTIPVYQREREPSISWWNNARLGTIIIVVRPRTRATTNTTNKPSRRHAMGEIYRSVRKLQPHSGSDSPTELVSHVWPFTADRATMDGADLVVRYEVHHPLRQAQIANMSDVTAAI